MLETPWNTRAEWLFPAWIVAKYGLNYNSSSINISWWATHVLDVHYNNNRVYAINVSIFITSLTYGFYNSVRKILKAG